jgi:hypothetical protein
MNSKEPLRDTHGSARLRIIPVPRRISIIGSARPRRVEAKGGKTLY